MGKFLSAAGVRFRTHPRTGITQKQLKRRSSFLGWRRRDKVQRKDDSQRQQATRSRIGALSGTLKRVQTKRRGLFGRLVAKIRGG